MVIAFFVGVVLYGAVTLVFLIVSSAELLDSGLSTASGLASVLLTSVFWPVTLIALSLLVLFRSRLFTLTRERRVPAPRLVYRSN
ncbi:hypothetical protein [Labrenzia sp. VG12]|uniref:hypothetical protein n=1 Tax=Labrenzia sp. VG12 TaxID=2021862 RepID=UPI000B8C08B5|nr:hypothetical protein [Labrenzia sp. VG12]ASP35366.1 hypothetical protein CHH27_20755 [Labrenzia sp. VG12]